MRVKELIEYLQKLPGENVVVIKTDKLTWFITEKEITHIPEEEAPKGW